MKKNISILISQVFQLKRKMIEAIKKELTISTEEIIDLEILKFVHQNKLPQMSDLAKHLCITRPSATSLINRLVKKQFLIRHTNENDRRYIHLHLSKKGEECLFDYEKRIQKFFFHALSELDEKDIQDLIRIHQKINSKI